MLVLAMADSFSGLKMNIDEVQSVVGNARYMCNSNMAFTPVDVSMFNEGNM